MSVEQRKVIDAVGIRKSVGRAVLTISDHLPWDADNQHLMLLQDKINDYLDFIESGEIYDSYPKAHGREIEIQVVHKYSPVGDAIIFLERAGETLRIADLYFSARSKEDLK